MVLFGLPRLEMAKNKSTAYDGGGHLRSVLSSPAPGQAESKSEDKSEKLRELPLLAEMDRRSPPINITLL